MFGWIAIGDRFVESRIATRQSDFVQAIGSTIRDWMYKLGYGVFDTLNARHEYSEWRK